MVEESKSAGRSGPEKEITTPHQRFCLDARPQPGPESKIAENRRATCTYGAEGPSATALSNLLRFPTNLPLHVGASNLARGHMCVCVHAHKGS